MKSKFSTIPLWMITILISTFNIKAQHVGINTVTPQFPLQINVDSFGIAPMLDQSNTEDSYGWEFAHADGTGQTFTCGISGPLCQVKLKLGGTPGNVYIEVRTGSDPNTGTVLTSTEIIIAGGQIQEHAVDFPLPYSNINEGQTYLMKVLNYTGGPMYVGLSTDNPYAQGMAFYYDNNWNELPMIDLGFKQYVEAPDTASVLVLAVQENGKVRIKDYELPEMDGNQDQIMFTNGLGQLTWKDFEDVIQLNNIHDADGNTKVHTEQTPNENAIRFILDGTEKFSMVKNQFNAARLNILDPGENIFIGKNAGLVANPALGYYNTFIGHQSGESNVGGAYNVAVGHKAFFNNNSGSGNTIIGEEAGLSNFEGVSNTAVGHMALRMNNSGNYNTALGSTALRNNEEGTGNTALGAFSLYANISGIYNTAIGYASLLANTYGERNVAIGHESLRYNTIGDNNVAIGKQALYASTNNNENIAIGTEALRNTASGDENTGIGYYAMRMNTTGFNNCAIGSNALQNNLSGNYNTAIGHNSLLQNTTGFQNTAVGRDALRENVDAIENTGIGSYSLYFNQFGDGNTAIGYEALKATTTGHNVAIGTRALSNNTTGTNRTALGYQSNNVGTTYSNNTGIGYLTNCTASNQVRIGNSSVSSIGGYEDWTNVSDTRFKLNVEENVPGLEFIARLRPVTYNMNLDAIDDFFLDHYNFRDSTEVKNPEKEMMRYTGFIAQEVESAASEIGYDFSGVDKPKNDDDFYGLRYAQFVVPLVKAVQELAIQNQTLQQQVDFLQAEVAALKENGE